MNKRINVKDTVDSKESFKKRKLYIAFAVITFLVLLWIRIVYGIGALGTENSGAASDTRPGDPIAIKYLFGKSAWMFFFTNITNFMFLVVTFVRIFYRKGIWNDRTQVAVGSYMIIVGLIYWTSIAPIEMKNRINYSMFSPDWFFFFILHNVLIHGVTVAFAITLMFVGVNKNNIRLFPTALYALIYPLAYYIMAWVVYLYTRSTSINNNPGYIYQFLNFFRPYGVHNIYAVIAVNIAFFLGILGIFFGIFYLVTPKKHRVKMVEKMTSTQIIKVQQENKTKKEEKFSKLNSENSDANVITNKVTNKSITKRKTTKK